MCILNLWYHVAPFSAIHSVVGNDFWLGGGGQLTFVWEGVLEWYQRLTSLEAFQRAM